MLDLNKEEDRHIFVYHATIHNIGMLDRKPGKLVRKRPMSNMYVDEMGLCFEYVRCGDRMRWVYQFSTNPLK